jgi:hypothetical protein
MFHKAVGELTTMSTLSELKPSMLTEIVVSNWQFPGELPLLRVVVLPDVVLKVA